MSQRDNAMEHRRNELLEDVHAHAKRVVAEYGIKEDVADQVGAAIAENLAINWGGQIVCIPKDHHYKIAARDKVIYDEFNGRNHSELARKYEMTVRGIYKVISRVRAKGDPNQTSLF